MSLEDELRDALRRDAERAPAGDGLDARTAIARSRARRRPRVALATGAGALVTVGVLAIAVPLVLRPLAPVATSSESAPLSQEYQPADGGSAQDSALRMDEACGSPLDLASSAPADAVEPPVTVAIEIAPLVAGRPAEAALVVTSTAEAPLTLTGGGWGGGVLGVDGIVAGTVELTTDATATPLAIAPGESVRVPATVLVTGCDAALPPGPAELLVDLGVTVGSDGGASLLPVWLRRAAVEIAP